MASAGVDPTDDADTLVEVYAARCRRCEEALEPAALADGRFSEWPVILASASTTDLRHATCGGPLVLGDVRPLGHVCAEGCECLSGGLPERAIW